MLWDILLVASQVIGGLVLFGLVFIGALAMWFIVFDPSRDKNARKPAPAVTNDEQGLDRQADEVRRLVLRLADQLAADRDEVSREMTRVAFLTTGQVPRSPQG